MHAGYRNMYICDEWSIPAMEQTTNSCMNACMYIASYSYIQLHAIQIDHDASEQTIYIATYTSEGKFEVHGHSDGVHVDT